MNELPRLLTLEEVAPLVRKSMDTCYRQLSHGRFPIRHCSERPYRFTEKDVREFVEHGRPTNRAMTDPRFARRRA